MTEGPTHVEALNSLFYAVQDHLFGPLEEEFQLIVPVEGSTGFEQLSEGKHDGRHREGI